MRSRQLRAFVAAISAIAVAGLAYAFWSQRPRLSAYAHVVAESIWPKVLSAVGEQVLRPGDEFKECTDCPVMIVVPAGAFEMGSPPNEAHDMDPDHKDYAQERPIHDVTIARPFAVAKFDITFADWDVCYFWADVRAYQATNRGRGDRPVIDVDWNDAKQYVAWLSKRTGKLYRLLSEAEFEYSARAGTTTAFSWGDEVGTNRADCDGCGSAWDNLRTAEVGRFKPNSFGFYDMHGNVWQWVEDCYTQDYTGAPTDGSAVVADNCQRHVVRGGSWCISGEYPLGDALLVRARSAAAKCIRQYPR